MKFVLSIGTGPNQSRLIAAAKAQKFAVLGVDRDEPAAGLMSDLVDDHIQISTFEADKIIDALERHPRRGDICAVLARTSGPAIISAARVADYLGLNGIPIDLAGAALSKSSLREQAAALDIVTPTGQCLSACPRHQGEPLIIKPDQSMFGKKNVFKCDSQDDLETAFGAAAAESLNGMVEVQDFVDGRDINLMTLSQGGRTIWSLGFEELNAFEGGRVSARGLASITDIDMDGLVDNAETLLRHWRVDRGFVFFTFRVAANGEASLYEVNPGLCGDGFAEDLFPSLYPGLDIFEVDVRVATGQPVSALPV